VYEGGAKVMQVQQVFKLDISEANMIATLSFHEGYTATVLDDCSWTQEDVTRFLFNHHITFGHIQANIRKLVHFGSKNTFPMVIAKGKKKLDGEDGRIHYYYDDCTEVDRSHGWNFREVMRIPMVTEGDCLAELIPSTEGEDGITIQNQVVKAKPGKPSFIEEGENVAFDATDNCFYAKAEGQVRFGVSSIHVHTVFEVKEDISYKIGNIDFLGTVIIHGDVPTGFTIKATGDIKVFGLIESANLQAKGSIYISEGVVGAKKGQVIAKENIYAGYVNQGNIEAGNGIYIEQSILHSTCSAQMEIICEKGSVIGGHLSTGFKMEARDVGNRLHTSTTISFGKGNVGYDSYKKLEQEKAQLIENLRRMKVLQFKLKESNTKTKNTLLTLHKVNNSYQKTEKQLQSINRSIHSYTEACNELDDAYLYVKGNMHPNTIVSFGKYKQTIDTLYTSIVLKIEQNDISLVPLEQKGDTIQA